MKATIKEQILTFLATSNKKSFSAEEIAEGLKLQKSNDFKVLIQTIAVMEREGTIVFNKKGKIKLPPQKVLVEGTFRANERGFGFVTIDPEEDDIFIPKEATGFAMDGDTVAIDIVKVSDPFSDRGAEGQVVEIRQRAVKQIVGEFTLFDESEIAESDLYGSVKPKDKNFNGLRVLVAAEGIKPVDGSIVIVEITHYPEKGYPTSIEGIIKQVIGHKNDPGMDILSIVISHGIPTSFPANVLAQADKVPETINPADFPERIDRSDQLIVTIDGEDAKDLDDAVTVKKLANGNFFLGVHIADVSYYVTEGSPLDQEAYERGTSVYLTDRVIPMIPQRLSNGICSLNPHVPRLTMSCEMEIDSSGKIVKHAIFPSIIQTSERMTYTAVNAIIENHDPEVSQRYEKLVPMFFEMAELHHILEQRRIQRGAVSFEDREAKVLVDEDGHPKDIILRSRGIGERLIESFMLAANETVAEHYNKLHLPFIYRIHEDPKEEKLQRFFDFTAALGMVVKHTKGSITPKDLQKVVADVAERPEAMVVNMMLLRSMQQAKYSEHNAGHYGLAADYYTHFTSPIRRYPDLIVHRLIRSYASTTDKKMQSKWQEKLPEIAHHSSDMERRAVLCEREVDAMKKAEFMQAHIGEDFDGVISSITKFGIFIELPNTIEGMIHISNLKDDYFHFVEQQLALVGERTGMTFKIGQKVRVKVTNANPETREIDFELVSAEEVTQLPRPQTSRKNRGGKKITNPANFRKKNSTTKAKTGDKKVQLKVELGNNKKKKGKKPFYKGVKKKKHK